MFFCRNNHRTSDKLKNATVRMIDKKVVSSYEDFMQRSKELMQNFHGKVYEISKTTNFNTPSNSQMQENFKKFIATDEFRGNFFILFHKIFNLLFLFYFTFQIFSKKFLITRRQLWLNRQLSSSSMSKKPNQTECRTAKQRSAISWLWCKRSDTL